jgi:transposase
MTNVQNYVGVDVSKNTLDIAIPKENGFQSLKINNDLKSFKQFENKIDKDCVLVMEASSTYYLPFAFYFYERGYKVAIVNPLVIKHFSKMRMSRTKTDKKDAVLLSKYGETEKPQLWKPKSKMLLEYAQLSAYLELKINHRSQFTNQIEAFKSSGLAKKEVIKMLEKERTAINKIIDQLEEKMKLIIELEYGDMLKRLESIPGIGKKTAMQLILTTQGLLSFKHINNSLVI